MRKRLSRRLVHKDPWTSVHVDILEDAAGEQSMYTVVGRGEHPGVAVLPLRAGQIGLVQQYRHPLEAATWEIPRGGAASSESEREALRELQEETGICCEELVYLGEVHPDTGVLDVVIRLYLAQVDPGSAMRAGEEVERAEWFPTETVWKMISAGEITDSSTLAGLLQALLRGLIDTPRRLDTVVPMSRTGHCEQQRAQET